MKALTKSVQQVGCVIAVCVLLGQAAFAQDAAPANAKAGTKVDTDRKIEALDMLTVNVFGEEEFSGTNNSGLELRVSSTGEVTLYLLGSVQVAGKTPAEAERHIRDLLKKDYIRDPHVLVLVKTYRVSNVTVMGQVGSPGLIDLPAERRLDILSGIAQAGGFTKLAKTSKIDLTRGGVTETYDLNKLKRETNPAKKIWLSPDDLIYVHESAF
ncbi:MAG: polysaccharide biosynthesis/export family protein [Verrucomicrobiota bacterium]|nr:polysaccharide biosynthesis/export family protein [Verrucomicrobiota bacterium]